MLSSTHPGNRQDIQIWQRVRPDLEPYGDPGPQMEITESSASWECTAVEEQRSIVYSQARQEDKKPDEAARLLAFIDDELRDHCYYLRMMRIAPCASVRAGLSRLAQDELTHYKRLSAAYFILTGEQAHCDSRVTPPVCDFCQALRYRYIGEKKGVAEYAAAADSAEDESLRCLYAQLAAQEEAHGAYLLCLLERFQ